MSRLTIDISEQQHQSLKAVAALKGQTIKQYAIDRLFPGDASEDQAWQALKILLNQRIAEGLSGEASALNIRSILDEELGPDGQA